MNLPLVYIIVLAAYFVLLIMIGFITQRSTKSTSDYHIGNRNIGPWVSALSFVSAYYSSVVIIGGGGFGYKFGLTTLWIAAINVLLGCFLAWVVLGKRTLALTKKLNAITLPDFLAKRYQLPFARVFISLVIALFLIVYNVSILKGLGDTFNVLLNIRYEWGVFISSLIVVIYVTFGGYLAVVWTGFIQGIIMFVSMGLLLWKTLQVTGGLTAGVVALKAMDKGLVETPGLWGFPGMISYVLVVSLGVWGMPQMLARFYSIKNNKAIRTGALIASVGAAMAFVPYLVGALARTKLPLTDPALMKNADLAIPMLAKAYLPPIVIALFFIGVIAAGMSTFSAVLIISAGATVRDLIKDSFKSKINDKMEIRWSMVCSLIVGLISMALALKPPGLVLQLTAFSWAVIASACLIPFLFGLYWNRTTKTGVIASMVGGFLVSIGWMILQQILKSKGPLQGIYQYHGFIPGVLASFILMVVVSWTTKDIVSIPTMDRKRNKLSV